MPVATLNNPSPATLDRFGTSVAISGTQVVVGAPNDAAQTGSAYVYDLTTATPTVPAATLHKLSPVANEFFGTAVAMQKQGLLPASQKALTVMGWLAYHDFEGPALNADEQPRIVADLGDRNILVLRNHGLLTVGESVGEAFVWMYRIETACRQQIDALSGGGELSPLSAETQQRSIAQGLKMYGKGGFIEVGREWPALLRQLERNSGTGYRA